ncbi:Mcd1 [Lachancea thermotolerans]
MTQSTSRTPTFIQLTSNNGPLAQIWLASNMSHTVSKSVSQQTDIVKSVKEIARVAGCLEDAESLEPITLRASGELLHGVVRVYSKKTSLLLNDIKDTLTRMMSLFRFNQPSLTLQLEKTTLTNPSQYLLQDAVTEREVLLVPGLEFLDEQAIPRGFMEREGLTERHVQGAAPWETSIEVGRNLRPGEELGHNTSSLELDFDLDNTQTKAWGEGTNTTINKSAQTNSALIGDDDFPIDDINDWDLGIRDQSIEAHSDLETDRSIELGRRAVPGALPQEHTEFDFDLELEKEPEERGTELSPEPEEISNVPMSSPPRGRRQRADASRLKPLITDSETELRDDTVKVSGVNPNSQVLVHHQHRPVENAEKKRLWAQVSESIDYLPQSILGSLLSYSGIKRARTFMREPQAIEEEPQLEASLGFDEGIITGHEEAEEFPAPFDSDGEVELENEAANSTSVSAGTQEFSSSQLGERSSPKIQLETGEYISEGTRELAGQLRTQFLDSETLKFSECLEFKADKDQLGERITKKQASKVFFELLSLANMDCIDLGQEADFGEISLTRTDSLYNKFVAV